MLLTSHHVTKGKFSILFAKGVLSIDRLSYYDVADA